MSRAQWSLFLVIFLPVVACLTEASAQTSGREQFKQYVSELQRNPNDHALREKIIGLALELQPPPAVPEEAERHMARGAAAFKLAREIRDFQEAVAEFESATLAAPWLADAYYNLGIAKDKAGDHAGALKSLKLYLMAAPSAPGAQQARTLIYEIEYRQEKVARDKAQEEAIRRAEDERFGWILGRWNVATRVPGYPHADSDYQIYFSKSGSLITGVSGNNTERLRGTVKAGSDIAWEYFLYASACPRLEGWMAINPRLSPDRRTMNFEIPVPEGVRCALSRIHVKYTLNR